MRPNRPLRHILPQRPRYWQKLLAALNSPLGLFLLSGVMLGVITRQYQSWEADQRQKGEVAKLLDSSELEIVYRVQLLRKTLSIEPPNPATLRFSKAIFEGKLPYVPTSKEFEDQSVLSIMTRVNSPREVTEVFPIRGAILLRVEGQRIYTGQTPVVANPRQDEIFSLAQQFAVLDVAPPSDPQKTRNDLLRLVNSVSVKEALGRVQARFYSRPMGN